MNSKHILSAILLLTSCTKMQDVTPVKNELYGVWVNENEHLQFSIKNTTGIGEVVRYTDIQVNGQRFLKVEMPSFTETYEISSIDNKKMLLLNSNSTRLEFKRIN